MYFQIKSLNLGESKELQVLSEILVDAKYFHFLLRFQIINIDLKYTNIGQQMTVNFETFLSGTFPQIASQPIFRDGQPTQSSPNSSISIIGDFFIASLIGLSTAFFRNPKSITLDLSSSTFVTLGTFYKSLLLLNQYYQFDRYYITD